MTEDQFKKLKAGDIVRHKRSSQGVIVTANYGGRVTAIRTHDLTQPHEWDLVLIAEYRDADADDSQPQECHHNPAPEVKP